MVKVKKVAWFSAGVSSFIATYLVRDSIDEIIYIHINDQHEDSMRFVKDCERVLQKEIKILQHEKYKSVADVIRATRIINTPWGAPCTTELKRNVRKKWERENYGHHTYIWGFDSGEQKRADRLVKSMSDYDHEFPLMEQGLTKADAHGLANRLGVRRPAMYDLGFKNNNCKICVKSGKYSLNLARKHFPEEFDAMAKLEREIGGTCLKGKEWLDELDPNAGRKHEEISEECGILCELAYNE